MNQDSMPRPARGAMDTPFPTPPASGDVIEVASGIFWLRLPLPMALDHVNIFALADDDGWTLIDTGMDTKRTRQIWAGLLTTGALSERPVRRVLVTHHHPDHIGLAGWFQAEYGAELITTRTAWLFARMLQLDEQHVAAEETLAFWTAAGMDAEILEARRAERPFNFADVVAPMPLGFRRLREGSTIKLGGRVWDVRMGNGHAPEHATLWSRDGDIVLGGDQLLPSISPNIGVYATEPEADPLAEWMEACERLARFATPQQLVLPGHKLPYRGLPTRLDQLIENHHGALARLQTYLQTPRVGGACFPALFRRPIKAGEYGLALVETVAHLNHLHAKGLVRREMGADGAWLWQSI